MHTVGPPHPWLLNHKSKVLFLTCKWLNLQMRNPGIWRPDCTFIQRKSVYNFWLSQNLTVVVAQYPQGIGSRNSPPRQIWKPSDAQVPYGVEQRFSTGVPQEFLEHAIPGYLVRVTVLFFLRWSNKKMTTANTTIAVWCEWIKIIPVFYQIGKKYNFWCATEF